MALHISPGGPKVGSFSVYNGIATTAFDLYNVEVNGQTAHGSQPHRGHDAILAAAQFVVTAQQIVARRINPVKTAIVSVGLINGGEAVNIIPSHVRMEMVCRTYGEEARAIIRDQILKIAHGIEEYSECRLDVEHIEGYSSVENDPKLIAIADEAVTEELGEGYMDYLDEPLSFSEDFGRLRPGRRRALAVHAAQRRLSGHHTLFPARQPLHVPGRGAGVRASPPWSPRRKKYFQAA